MADQLRSLKRSASERSRASEKSGEENENKNNVSVVVRLRPPTVQDEDITQVFKAENNNQVTVLDPLSRGRMEHSFTFNRVFLPEHGQEMIFEHVAKPLIDRLLLGYNSCCFAYGQTGSGKTHSVFGEGNAEQRGMLARSIEHLFEKIEAQAAQNEVGMVVSFLEIYLDKVRDLGRFYLSKGMGDDVSSWSPHESRQGVASRPSSAGSLARPPRPSSASGSRPASAKSGGGESQASRSGSAREDRNPLNSDDLYPKQDLAIHETPQGLVYVEDLALIPVSNIREVLDVANLGVRMRATYETRLNARSSRSHTIFSVSIVQKSKTKAQAGVVGSVVNFVDLAGSERLAKSQSEGRRFQEAVMINSSLSALGKVVLALASGSNRHIPYRDSKLTRILQNSLGGNSYTTMLTTIDPSSNNYEESLNSLFFADRCQNVQTKPVQNLVENNDEAYEKQVARLTLEITQLRHQLEVASAMNSMHGRAGSGAGPGKSGASGRPSGHGEEDDAASSVAGGRTGGGRLGLLASLPDAFEGLGPLGSDAQSQVQEKGGGGLNSVVAQAELRLRIERRQALAAADKAHEAQDRVALAKLEQLNRDAELRKEAHGIRKDVQELELDLMKCKRQMEIFEQNDDAERRGLAHTLHSNASTIKMGRVELLRSMTKTLAAATTTEYESGLTLHQRLEAEDRQTEHQWQCDAAKMKMGFDGECAKLELQHQQWCAEKDFEGQQFKERIEEVKAKGKTQRKELAGELVSAHDLLIHLFQVVDGLQSGVPNIWPRSDIRLPGGGQDEQGHRPQDALLDASQRPSSAASSRRPGSAASRQRPGSATRSSCAGSSNPSLATLLSGLPEPPLRPDAAEIRRRVASYMQVLKHACYCPGHELQAFAVAESGTGRILRKSFADAPKAAAASWWDADAFAWEFCDEVNYDQSQSLNGDASSTEISRTKPPKTDTKGAPTAEAALERLDLSRLKALGLALHRRARMTEASKSADRAKLFRAIASDLAEDNHVNKIRNLEKEIEGYQKNTAKEEELARQTELALRGCAITESKKGQVWGT
eukprot:TRINITY_DN22027_c1_g3_i1.p1 TRINITY_DN22027_c1_g3~~TRINITY_DN22027_c1_g3_i1.p1  ORF type:complete len:1053 (-),score=199.25 TRINITY_DN22027_c1_g3_i1:289-3447(-)